MPRLRAEDAARRAASGHGPDFLEAVARGLRVIHAFGTERRPMTLSDVARAADMPKPTVGRVLHTLEVLGYVECEGRLFRLTPHVLTLANAFLGSDPVSAIVQPLCERISRTVGESCFAGVLDGQHVVTIAHATPRHPMNLATSIGLRHPAFATAAGRVLLAALPDAELDAWLAELKPEALTFRTMIDRAALREAVLRCREDGHCVTDQESVLGYRAVAFPLKRRDGRTVGALSTPLRIEHCEREPDLLERCTLMLRKETTQLARELP